MLLTIASTPANGLTSATSSNPNASPTATTSYEVLVTDNISTCTTKDTAFVKVGNPAASAGVDKVVCGTGSVIIGSPSLANTTYAWTTVSGSATYMNGTSASSAQPEVTVSTNTVLALIATDNTSGCFTYDTVKVNYDTGISITLNDVNFCPGAGIANLATATGLTGTYSTYNWSPAAVLSSSWQSTSAAPSVSAASAPSVPTTMTLLVTNAAGCSASDQFVIIPTSTAPAVISGQNICYSSNPIFNQSIAIGGAPEAGSTYSWSPSAGLNNAAISNPTFTPTAVGSTTFTVTKTTSTGCITTNKVTINATSADFAPVPDVVTCNNTTVQIGTTPLAGVSYSWSPSTNLSNPLIANPTITVTTPGISSYSLMATTLQGCQYSDEVVVSVSTASAPGFIIACDILYFRCCLFKCYSKPYGYL